MERIDELKQEYINAHARLDAFTLSHSIGLTEEDKIELVKHPIPLYDCVYHDNGSDAEKTPIQKIELITYADVVEYHRLMDVLRDTGAAYIAELNKINKDYQTEY